MTKKKTPEISPTKPVKDLDAFVHGERTEQAPAATTNAGWKPTRPAAGVESKRLPRGARERKDGTVVRQLTIYLPVDLAKKLAIFCAEHDRETSDVIAEGLGLVVK